MQDKAVYNKSFPGPFIGGSFVHWAALFLFVVFSQITIAYSVHKFYRCNTSLLIDYCQDGVHNYIIIDVGKTFREQVLRWFTRHKIPRIDSVSISSCESFSIFMSKFMVFVLTVLHSIASVKYWFFFLPFLFLQIILTHEHADAVLGLDDVRVVQHDTNPIPIYCTQFTMDRYIYSCRPVFTTWHACLACWLLLSFFSLFISIALVVFWIFFNY